MSVQQAAAITACTACAAVGGAAAGGAFSGDSSVVANEEIPEVPPKEPKQSVEEVSEPVWVAFEEEITTTNSATYENKIGKKYGHFLLAVIGKEETKNEVFWKKLHTKFTTDQGVSGSRREFSEKFLDTNKVTEAYSENTATALNKVCESVYKEETSKIGKDGDLKKLRDDLWRYCSVFETAPLTVEDKASSGTPGTGTIGEAKKQDLLDASSDENNVFWDHKDKEFKALTRELTEKIFKDKHVALKKEQNIKLKDICKEVYAKTTSDTQNSPTAEETAKYCSFLKIV